MRLDDTSRMNTPGKAEGNWAWRVGGAGVWEQRGEEAPGEKFGAREADDGNGGDGKVQDERCWSHHLGGNPSQGH